MFGKRGFCSGWALDCTRVAAAFKRLHLAVFFALASGDKGQNVNYILETCYIYSDRYVAQQSRAVSMRFLPAFSLRFPAAAYVRVICFCQIVRQVGENK